MKSVVLIEPGYEPKFDIIDVPVLRPSSQDVVVRVAACGLCRHDVSIMQGILRRGVEPGVVLGHEISGQIIEVGDSVTDIKIGDSVVATLTGFCGECSRCTSGRTYRCVFGRGIGQTISGGLAEFVTLPSESVVPVPEGIDMVLASIAACPIGVAFNALTDVAKVQPKDTVLVTGAGGGLGVHACQLASALGAKVIGITSSPKKEQLLLELGFGDVVVVDGLDFSEVVLAITDDRGADVVIETVGSALFNSSVQALSQYGRMILLGEVTGVSANVNLAEILFRDAKIIGSTGAERHHVTDALAMIETGLVRPIVAQVFGMDEINEAFQLASSSKAFGRVVLSPVV